MWVRSADKTAHFLIDKLVETNFGLFSMGWEFFALTTLSCGTSLAFFNNRISPAWCDIVVVIMSN